MPVPHPPSAITVRSRDATTQSSIGRRRRADAAGGLAGSPTRPRALQVRGRQRRRCPAMSLAGLVSHLRWVEHCWFEALFLGRPTAGNPQFGEVEDADFEVGDTPLDELLDAYARQCAVSNEITAAASLDAFGANAE